MRRATGGLLCVVGRREISIHALHEESDGDGLDQHERIFGFQSTLSMRRATRRGPGHSGRGRISIHALHEESDRAVAARSPSSTRFQSTLSMRRATALSTAFTTAPMVISIHALQEEGDRRVGSFEHFIPAISIHALHEESDKSVFCKIGVRLLFQSTLSMRRATST